MLILKALHAVQKEIHTVGIGKFRENKEQKFNFRGIDDALAAFAPLLTEHGILLSPSYANKVIEARQTKSGGTTYNVSLEGTFTFTHIEDGSQHVVGPFFGEANDGQDRAVSKATSVAERNMFFLTFVVPHEPAIGGDPDGITGDEPAPEYLDWKEAIAGEFTVDGLKRVKNEIVEKFGDAIPKVLIDLCLARMAAIKAEAAK